MPVPVKTVTSDETPSPYAVNKTLFEEATAVKDKMKMVEGRLQKMDEHRGEVSDTVYLKVKTDYEVQLDEVRGLFNDKSREVENELRQLYQARSEQEEYLAGHQQILEEAKFRHTLGEFNDKKFKEIEIQQNKEIKKYNDLLDAIKASIKQYEDILGHSYQPQTSARAFEKPTSVAEPKITPPSAPAAKASPATGVKGKNEATPDEGFEAQLSDELDMFLETEGDYFSEEPHGPSPAPETPIPPQANKPGPAPVSKTKPVEDSISTILRDIPLDEEGGEIVTKAASEETGAHINIQEVLAEASLLLVEGELDESEFILGENTSIGRSPSNDIVLKESKISRQHASINYHNGNYVLVDLKSSNGVFVNGKKVEEAALKDGDEISVGSFKFQFNLA